jgi:protein phosphatase
MSRLDRVEREVPLLIASRTDVGRVRQANEDSCGVFEDATGGQLLLVADGMGGHRGGATASHTAVTVMAERFAASAATPPTEMLRSAIAAANARIYEQAQQEPALRGMGTTVVALHIDARRNGGVVAHVGDSRAYRYRAGRLEALTTDHSVVAEMQQRGLLSAEEAAVHPRRNEILRSVGVLDHVDVDVREISIRPGDHFLLCSDGLSGVVRDDEIAAAIRSRQTQDAVDSLIRLANERGGPDNITVQIVSVPVDASHEDPEATAPIELTHQGIAEIESIRHARQRRRRLRWILFGLLLLGLGGLVWRALTA